MLTIPAGSRAEPRYAINNLAASKSTARLATVLRQLLLGLAKQLVPAGITPKYFSELTYRAFVDAAADISRCRNGRVNRSRVAVLTSLRRAEVTRLLQEQIAPLLYRKHRPRTDQVIAAWTCDKRYLDAQGLPRRLPLRGRNGSFSSLVKEFAGDVPPRAVLEELRRLNVVKKDRNSMDLIGIRRKSNRAPDRSAYEVMKALIEGLEFASHGKSSSSPSQLYRVALRPRDSIDLEMMRERASVGAGAFLEGLDRSLSAPSKNSRKGRKMNKELTISVLVREHSGEGGRASRRRARRQ